MWSWLGFNSNFNPKSESSDSGMEVESNNNSGTPDCLMQIEGGLYSTSGKDKEALLCVYPDTSYPVPSDEDLKNFTTSDRIAIKRMLAKTNSTASWFNGDMVNNLMHYFAGNMSNKKTAVITSEAFIEPRNFLYDLYLGSNLPSDGIPEKGRIYCCIAENNKLAYRVSTPKGTVETQVLENITMQPGHPLTIEILEELKPVIIAEAAQREHIYRLPMQKKVTELQQAEVIFCPIEMGNHWYLLILERYADNAYHFSCIDGFNSIETHRVMYQLAVRLVDHLHPGMKIEKTARSLSIPSQHNCYDCGAVILFMAEQYCAGFNLSFYEKLAYLQCNYSGVRHKLASIYATHCKTEVMAIESKTNRSFITPMYDRQNQYSSTPVPIYNANKTKPKPSSTPSMHYRNSF